MPCPVPNPPIEEEPSEKVSSDVEISIDVLDSIDKWKEQIRNANRSTLIALRAALRELKLG